VCWQRVGNLLPVRWQWMRWLCWVLATWPMGFYNVSVWVLLGSWMLDASWQCVSSAAARRVMRPGSRCGLPACLSPTAPELVNAALP
jgi:hypothetical protein